MAEPESRWTFLSNHAYVLVCIARNPDTRLRDIAQDVGITERAAQGILGDLVEAGYVERTRVGRRNTYVVDMDVPLRHELERGHSVGDLVRAVGAGRSASGPN